MRNSQADVMMSLMASATVAFMISNGASSAHTSIKSVVQISDAKQGIIPAGTTQVLR